MAYEEYPTLFAANTILGTCCLDLANFTASVTPPRERSNLQYNVNQNNYNYKNNNAIE